MTISVWAPYAKGIRLVGDVEATMEQTVGGWFASDVSLHDGDRYGFVLCDSDGSTLGPFPDPRTRRQPGGIHELSQWQTTDYDWTDDAWAGRSLAGEVIYELHVGTFTPEGTFAGVVDKLDYLLELGVTAIELMPVQPFGGERNWGYDGVEWYAVQESYGGPEGLKALIDAAHNKGLAVIMDVVYNHFGPDGNYLGLFGPYTQPGNTGWGDVVNISGPGSDGVRAYILGTVAQWLDEYHVDGLRLDAVHAYDDRRAYSIMEEIQHLADDIAGRTGKPRWIIAESDLNDPKLLEGYGLTGQWVDDYHHAIHTLVSGENNAYYCDFGTMHILAETLRKGWWFTDEVSKFRGRHHGRALDLEKTKGWQLVSYTTTHDQTGNRATGDRPSMYLSPQKQVLKAALVYCSPYTPMLFMGEEFGARTPFAFFVSHLNEELNRLTSEGRHREFSRSGWNADEVPNPADPATFESSRLVWDFDDQQQEILNAYATLLRLRRELSLAHPDLRTWNVVTGGEEHRWIAFGSGEHMLLANLSDATETVPFGGELVYSFDDPSVTPESSELSGWSFALIKRS